MTKSEAVWVLGTMSGTSLDGVDAALLKTDGERIIDFGRHGYRPYLDAERAAIRAALGRWPGEEGVARAAAAVELAHTVAMSRLAGSADLAGFHGQTLAHEPAGRGTHQAGDGSVLADALGLPVAWDFRSADVRMGGQGAPLAPFFHFACAKWIGADEPVAFLNLGGVGNFTWLDPRQPTPDLPGACLAFDTGPANAPIDDLVFRRRGLSRDEGGTLAAQGQVDEEIVSRFLAHPYFFKVPPKSLDRDAFPGLAEAVADLSDADAAVTLTAAAAVSVHRGARHFPEPVARILVTGGGRHNTVLMAMLNAAFDVPVEPVEVVGLNGDMLEAQAFAFLAARVQRGLPTSCPGTTGVRAAVGGGTISRPNA